MSTYVYQPAERLSDFDAAVAALARSGRRVALGGIDNASPGSVRAIVQAAQREGVPFYEFVIDTAGFEEYKRRAGYHDKHKAYSDFYSYNLVEKLLEHFVTLQLL